ncbi:hypothetical protein BGZ76_001303 [Entomortierella beljakovae]|nr:hypothetical protein BGZ76_001303 [Entomortierella beljakovae]
MAPIASAIILAISLLGSMVASSPISSPDFTLSNTTYAGFVNAYTQQYNGCPEVLYTADEPVAAISSTMFNKLGGASACGKYVKFSLPGEPSQSYSLKIVDVCSDCDESTLQFSQIIVDRLAISNTFAVNWELAETDNEVVTNERIVIAAASKKTSKYRGRGTWFSDKMGSCGHKFSQKDMIVALNEAQMGKMWGKGSKCGQKIRVGVRGQKKTVVVKIVDTCPHRFCSHGQLDLSQAAFKKFAPMSQGILDLEWTFV